MNVNQNSNTQGNLGNNAGQNFSMQQHNNANCWNTGGNNTGTNNWNMGPHNNNNMDPNATGNDGSIHFNGQNNNQYMGRNMGMNDKSNPNAIGNDGFEHFNANTNNEQNKRHDLTRYQNKNTSSDRNIDNTPAWMNKKDTP